MIDIRRHAGGRLEIAEPAALAVRFFSTDISAVGPDSYDERARATDPTAPFEDADVEPIRTGMRLGRLDKSLWTWLVEEAPEGYLTALGPDWDLGRFSFDDWAAVRPAVKDAVGSFIGEGQTGRGRHQAPALQAAPTHPDSGQPCRRTLGVSIPELKNPHPDQMLLRRGT